MPWDIRGISNSTRLDLIFRLSENFLTCDLMNPVLLVTRVINTIAGREATWLARGPARTGAQAFWSPVPVQCLLPLATAVNTEHSPAHSE